MAHYFSALIFFDIKENVTALPSILSIQVNKSVQNNLERRLRRGAVAHVRRKVPIGYNGAPQIRPQKYPYPWTNS